MYKVLLFKFRRHLCKESIVKKKLNRRKTLSKTKTFTARGLVGIQTLFPATLMLEYFKHHFNISYAIAKILL